MFVLQRHFGLADVGLSARGIALVFTLAGVFGVVLTLVAFRSKYYRQLSAAYAGAPDASAAQPA